jgi:hypothetical protein
MKGQRQRRTHAALRTGSAKQTLIVLRFLLVTSGGAAGAFEVTAWATVQGAGRPGPAMDGRLSQMKGKRGASNVQRSEKTKEQIRRIVEGKIALS